LAAEGVHFTMAGEQKPTQSEQFPSSPRRDPIRIRLGRNVSSADAKVGESVDLEVLDEIKVADTVVIPKSAIPNKEKYR
jgi:hypothetical protein